MKRLIESNKGWNEMIKGRTKLAFWASLSEEEY